MSEIKDPGHYVVARCEGLEEERDRLRGALREAEERLDRERWELGRALDAVESLAEEAQRVRDRLAALGAVEEGL